MKDKRNIDVIKKELSDELISNLRNCDDSVLYTLIEHGYSLEEVIELITKYNEKSGADLVICNNIIKKSLIKK